ncbi:MAG: T9SS type A sorting domain-containing protein, partial [Bacteroidetes bacterium]|nr:T9SS type A sorting domain-containing protein [Bacteroidota bacterium]
TQLVPLTDMTVYNTPDAELSEEVGDVNIPAPSDANRALQGYNVYLFGEFLDFTVDTTYLYEVDSSGLYTFEVTAVYEDCESDTAAGPVSIKIIVGIEELLADDNIAVFPNPAREVVNIVSTDDITYVTMLNNVGQLVYNKKVVNDNVLEINVTGFEAGIYMIKIETAENIIIEKVLITH